MVKTVSGMYIVGRIPEVCGRQGKVEPFFTLSFKSLKYKKMEIIT